MADPRFFQTPKPSTLGEMAILTGAEAQRGAEDIKLLDLAPLDQAESHHLSFLDNVRFRDAFRASRAGACFVHPDMAGEAPAGMALLVTKTPYKAYALAAQHFYPESWPEQQVSATARIDSTASIGEGCVIGEYVVIGAGAQIGAGCWIETGAVIGRNVVLGAKCRVGAHVSLSHCVVGQATRFYPGVRVGQDGFGFAIDPVGGHVKVPQLGRVLIGDHAEIGANTCIDRGAASDTVIGDGVWIDNLVQIGHNVKIGRGAILVSQSGVAGSSEIGDFAVLAGQAGIAGHLKVGMGARVGAQAGVMRDIPPKTEVIGSPAVPLRQFMRQYATLERMASIKKKGARGDEG